jgi:hypothetical protein
MLLLIKSLSGNFSPNPVSGSAALEGSLGPTASSPVRKDLRISGASHRPQSHLVKTIWHPTLDGAVNKRFLSTGETREFAFENAGFGLNPGVELAIALIFPSNQRGRLGRVNLRNVADMDAEDAGRRCQQNRRLELGHKSSGSPKYGFPTFSLKVS